ncbi:MAG TPA: (d)CMP kinase [Tepidimicrobium sp.]|nr:(d)CMP kinase [Tepidimicrobium sp.]
MGDDSLIIAVDGPAGSGKSTLAKKIANILEIEYIDTGAMYRALTLKVIEAGIHPMHEEEVLKLLNNTTISFKNNHIYLDGIMVDDKIRENIINKKVSDIAKISKVREEMVNIQKELARSNNVIMDGRDIGTVVLPDANFKFFITASVEERARRRYRELIERGERNITYQETLQDIENRDRIDSTRKVSPLLKSSDSYEIDTTDKTIDQSVEEILNIIRGGK